MEHYFVDLYTKEYPADETIIEFTAENADERLKSVCEKALYDKYGKDVPEFIIERYNFEIENTIKHGFAPLYIFASLLVKKSLELGYSYNLNSRTGGSFIAYLMGISDCNPLPPHYYCPKCKHTELVDAEKYPSGFDLNCYGAKQKACPHCGEQLIGDGHNIPAEFFLGLDGDMFPSFNFNFSGRIDKIVRSMYVERGNSVNGITIISVVDNTDPAKFLEYINLQFPIFLYRFEIQRSLIISELKLMEEFTGVKAKSIKLSEIDIHSFFSEDRLIGLPFDDKFVKDAFAIMPPARFSDFLRIMGLTDDSGGMIKNDEEWLNGIFSPESLIDSRDDVMLTLLRYGIDRKTAYAISIIAMKGKGAELIPIYHETSLHEKGVPEQYIESLKKIKHLYPKAYLVEDTVAQLRMIWYKINYPAAFYAAILSFIATNNEYDCDLLVLEDSEYFKYILNKDDLSNQRKMFFEIALECCARDSRFDFSLYKYWSDTDLYHMSIFMPEGNIIHLPYYTNVNL